MRWWEGGRENERQGDTGRRGRKTEINIGGRQTKPGIAKNMNDSHPNLGSGLQKLAGFISRVI
eukprot:1263088-Amorphochlora_amoeboformis.AAC.1